MTDDDALTVDCTFRPFGAEKVVLRQIALGLTPLILIEGEERGDDVIFTLDATGLDQEETAQMLRLIASALEDGDEQ